MRQLPFALALSALALAATPVLAGPPTGAVVADIASFHYATAIASPRTVSLHGYNGDVTVTPSTDGKLDVHVVAHDGDPKRMRVITRDEPGGVTVCVLFADESPERCRQGGLAGSSGGAGHDNTPSIEIVARVPANVALTLGTMNGDVSARGFASEVRAATLNGNVVIAAGAIPSAKTVNGNVDATLSRAPAGDASFTTTNGNVELHLASGTDADVEAATVTGEIDASFPMSVTSVPGGFGPKNGHAKLGKGGARIEVRTVTGNVEIHAG